jgi:hypothetical protein
MEVMEKCGSAFFKNVNLIKTKNPATLKIAGF